MIIEKEISKFLSLFKTRSSPNSKYDFTPPSKNHIEIGTMQSMQSVAWKMEHL